MPRLNLSKALRSFDVDELACCRATKAMHAAAVDIQGITTLPHDAFETVLPLMAIRVVQIHESARKIQLLQYIDAQDLNSTYSSALADELDTLPVRKDFVGTQM